MLIALSLISAVSHMLRVPRSSSDSSHREMDCTAKDLRVAVKIHEVNGIDHKIKEEQLPPPQRRFARRQRVSLDTNSRCRLRFRYFCIFCKMDFLSADEFLDHLEMHPNGSFVLVKRDLLQPTPAPSEPPESEEAEEEHSPILPEALRDQIKVRLSDCQLLKLDSIVF